MSQAFGGWVLDHHALAAWTRVEPYAQAVVWSALEIGMAIVVPVATLPWVHATLGEFERGVLQTLLELPVTILDPLTDSDAPALGHVLAGAAEPSQLGPDALTLACVVHSARRRGWPVVSGDATALRAVDPALDIDELP